MGSQKHLAALRGHGRYRTCLPSQVDQGGQNRIQYTSQYVSFPRRQCSCWLYHHPLGAKRSLPFLTYIIRTTCTGTPALAKPQSSQTLGTAFPHQCNVGFVGGCLSSRGREVRHPWCIASIACTREVCPSIDADVWRQENEPFSMIASESRLPLFLPMSSPYRSVTGEARSRSRLLHTAHREADPLPCH